MKRIARSHDRRQVIKEGPRANPGTRHERSRGQVLVIFAGAAFVLMALMALVVDVSWYWANTLKVQRAADAAALAGAVWLPGQPDCATGACFVARQEAAKNGYTNGSGGVTVAATQDLGDPRQLDVQVSAPVSTFFMRAIGISTINATRASKGLYVLPVPMGSPLAYYGVGDFYVNTGVPPVSSAASYTVPSTVWGTPLNAWKTGTSSYTTSGTNNQQQVWSNLNIPATGTTISGIVVSFNAKVSAAASACKVKAELSWNGSTWGNSPETTGNLTTGNAPYTLGTSSDPLAWDTGHTWVANDFTNANIDVRLTYLKGSSCGTLSLNQLVVTVYSSAIQKVNVKDPNNTLLPSLGAWGAVITRGGNEQNGDAYAPENNGGSPYSGQNSLYNGSATNGGGYLYAIKLPAGGTVNVFDPGFCAMGGNPSGAGNLGAGDHWIGSSGTAVSTYYTLWNTNGLLGLDPSSWGAPVYSSGSLFDGQNGYDAVNGSNPGGATSGCDAYHNAWFTLPTGTLAAGTYALQVSTTKPTDASNNSATNAENMFAIEAIGGADASGNSPAIYGNGKMAVYNNLQPGNSYQLFYLAKIDRNAGAGKTALIDIFDPGDVPGDATLKVLSPDAGVQTQATFSYTTDSNCNATAIASGWAASDLCSDSNVSSIITSVGGHSSFNNTWIHIRIPLPASYGLNGLWQGGWWQIRYETPGGGNDTTTWQVSISGNPVHLTVP